MASLLIINFPLTRSGAVDRKGQETGEHIRVQTLAAAALSAVTKWGLFAFLRQ